MAVLSRFVFVTWILEATYAQWANYDMIAAELNASSTVQRIFNEVPHRTWGILYSESLALFAATRAGRIDVMIESGTATGFSAELMSRFFQDSGGSP
eukprot:4578521-Pyramimonas_sp.AAC.1